MPLPTDPETLRVPAFMRKRSLNKRSLKPVLLTALDRKQAGILPEGLQKPKVKKSPTANRATRSIQKKINNYARPKTIEDAMRSVPADLTPVPKKITRKARALKSFTKSFASFEPPIVEPVKIKKSRVKKVAKITHYYEKIQVGVLQILDAISVGDCIQYETEDGPYEQVVDSMEINRTPVFKATKGDDVGIKLAQKPILGCVVVRQV